MDRLARVVWLWWRPVAWKVPLTRTHRPLTWPRNQWDDKAKRWVLR